MKRKNIVFNLPQLLTMLSKALVKVLEWGRGTGKSTIIGYHVQELAHMMPRACFNLVGATYQQILTRTLPSTISSLERLGYYNNIHYCIGKRGINTITKIPFPEPLEPPLNYKHFWHWHTGAGFHFVSQDRAGSGRGLNTDGLVADEAALLDKERLDLDVRATNRGNLKRFQHCHLHHSEFYASTIPLTESGKWLYKLQEESIKNPEEIFYLRASAKENIQNLGEKWFRDMKRSMMQYLYNAEILNIRPEKIEGGFYGQLNSTRHYYTNFDYGFYDSLGFKMPSKLTCQGDADIDKSRSLEISVDWGGNINSMVVGQEFETHSGKEFRSVKEFFVLWPKFLDHLFQEEFITYYEPFPCKHVFFHYDRNGNAKVGNSPKTFYQQAEALLIKAGWRVTPVYHGKEANHAKKYNLINRALAEKDTGYPKLRFNKANCPNLIISMENAPLKDEGKGLEKNKNSEKLTVQPRQEWATHLSDAYDIIIWDKYRSLIEKPSFESNLILS